MLSFEVNDFIERIDEMLRMVVEEREAIEITKQGEIISRIVLQQHLEREMASMASSRLKRF